MNIYYSDLWENANKFSGFEDDLIFNFGGDCISQMIKDGGIPRLLQAIQYEAYHQFAGRVLDRLEDED